MATITTHVLDTARGTPAAGISVHLTRAEDKGIDAGIEVGMGITDADGRCRSLTPDSVAAGTYRLSFDVGAYFANQGIESFYPRVEVFFHVKNQEQHFHVPLLLAPFGYSTYRGS